MNNIIKNPISLLYKNFLKLENYLKLVASYHLPLALIKMKITVKH